jgi:hypothetical protein
VIPKRQTLGPRRREGRRAALRATRLGARRLRGAERRPASGDPPRHPCSSKDPGASARRSGIGRMPPGPPDARPRAGGAPDHPDRCLALGWANTGGAARRWLRSIGHQEARGAEEPEHISRNDKGGRDGIDRPPGRPRGLARYREGRIINFRSGPHPTRTPRRERPRLRRPGRRATPTTAAQGPLRRSPRAAPAR